MIKIILIILIIIFCIMFIVLRIPVKKAVTINLETVKQERISDSDKVLICQFSTTTGPQWKVIGKNNGLFATKEPYEYIIIKGNFPYKRLNADLFMYLPHNKFVIQGNFVGEMKGEDEDIYKVFEVEKWDVMYPISRGEGFVNIIPKDSLTLYDFIPLKK